MQPLEPGQVTTGYALSPDGQVYGGSFRATTFDVPGQANPSEPGFMYEGERGVPACWRAADVYPDTPDGLRDLAVALAKQAKATRRRADDIDGLARRFWERSLAAQPQTLEEALKRQA
jgi:hypothetical protein